MELKIEFSKKFRKDMLKIPKELRKKVLEKIKGANKNSKFIPLADSDFCKIRMGEYRIIALKEKDKLIIQRIGHRRNIYKKI